MGPLRHTASSLSPLQTTTMSPSQSATSKPSPRSSPFGCTPSPSTLTAPPEVRFPPLPFSPTPNDTHTDDLVSDMIYHPPLVLANGHHGPSALQATLTLPPNHTLALTLALGKTFLKYTEHPPDAMRGWDLPPAVLFPVTVGAGSIPGRMYTPTLLVDLPTPDFSMPYNVIILSCTLMTLIFGSIFNLLTRKWMVVKLAE